MNRNIFQVVVIAASMITITSCGGAAAEQNAAHGDSVVAAVAPPAAPLKDLQWLNGWWQKVTPDGVVFETWDMNSDAMAGRSGFIKGKDTMLSETITLTRRDGEIYYTPTVKGQNNDEPVPFKLTAAAADSFVFENPEHDFPSRIVYRKVSATALVATISGKVKGKERAVSFDMEKVQ